MGMKPQTIALIAAGTAVSLGVGYLVYFDYKRRNDPQFRRKLSKVLTNLSCCLRTTRVCWQKTLSLSCKNYVEREQKKLAKEAKKAEEKAKLDIAELIKSVLDAASKEAYPKTPEEKEKYFMEQVALGEGLCAKGLYDTIFRGKNIANADFSARWTILRSGIVAILQGAQDLPCTSRVDNDLPKDSSSNCI